MNPDQLLTFITERKRVALAALVIDDVPSIITPIADSDSPPPPALKKRSIFGSIAMVGCALVFAGCALFTREQTPKTVLALKDIACIAANAFLGGPEIDAICGLLSAEQKQARAEVVHATRQGVARELALRAQANACTQDAGPDASDGGR